MEWCTSMINLCVAAVLVLVVVASWRWRGPIGCPSADRGVVRADAEHQREVLARVEDRFILIDFRRGWPARGLS